MSWIAARDLGHEHLGKRIETANCLATGTLIEVRHVTDDAGRKLVYVTCRFWRYPRMLAPNARVEVS